LPAKANPSGTDGLQAASARLFEMIQDRNARRYREEAPNRHEDFPIEGKGDNQTGQNNCHEDNHRALR